MAPPKDHKEPPEHKVRRQSFERRLMCTFNELNEATRQFKLLCRAGLCLWNCGEHGLSHEVLTVADKRAAVINELCQTAIKCAQKGD